MRKASWDINAKLKLRIALSLLFGAAISIFLGYTIHWGFYFLMVLDVVITYLRNVRSREKYLIGFAEGNDDLLITFMTPGFKTGEDVLVKRNIDFAEMTRAGVWTRFPMEINLRYNGNWQPYKVLGKEAAGFREEYVARSITVCRNSRLFKTTPDRVQLSVPSKRVSGLTAFGSPNIKRNTTFLFMKLIHICWLFLYACQGPGDTPDKPLPDSVVNRDINKTLPVRKEPLWSEGYYIKNTVAGMVPIDSIEHGYDSIQIRVWQVEGLFSHRQLYVFKNDGKRWKGYFYELTLDSDYGSGVGTREFLHGPQPFELTKFKKLNPKMGWQKFIDSLIALRILDLPDFSEVAGMRPKTLHPSSIIVEIAKADTYRHYTYLNVESFTDKFWQAENMSKIMMLISDYLGQIPRFA
jgi:hypothetical protein